MEAPGRVRGMKRRHEPRGQPHFVLPPDLYNGTPGRGTFRFQIFIRTPSPEIWSETISGGEEVLARKWGGLFWATSLEKIFGGVIVTRLAAFMQGLQELGWAVGRNARIDYSFNMRSEPIGRYRSKRQATQAHRGASCIPSGRWLITSVAQGSFPPKFRQVACA